MSEVIVRPLHAGDERALTQLLDGLVAYEHLSPQTTDARDRLVRDALASPPRFWTLLAEIDSQPVGYALYFETYSTLLALPTLYLEDLFVLPEFRERGVGAVLFRACAAEAVRRGCGRMEWQVLAWNDLALGFYQHLGATALHEDWLCYRLTDDALQRAASSVERA